MTNQEKALSLLQEAVELLQTPTTPKPPMYQGDCERGAEVIAALEALGGNNSSKYSGVEHDSYYFIDGNGKICALPVSRYNDILHSHFTLAELPAAKPSICEMVPGEIYYIVGSSARGRDTDSYLFVYRQTRKQYVDSSASLRCDDNKLHFGEEFIIHHPSITITPANQKQIQYFCDKLKERGSVHYDREQKKILRVFQWKFEIGQPFLWRFRFNKHNQHWQCSVCKEIPTNIDKLMSENSSLEHAPYTEYSKSLVGTDKFPDYHYVLIK